jgi:hypothetical protein
MEHILKVRNTESAKLLWHTDSVPCHQTLATVGILTAFSQKAAKDLLNREQSLDLDIKKHHGKDGDGR